jgi:two-component system, NtrC family, sensor histidine kinase HydH
MGRAGDAVMLETIQQALTKRMVASIWRLRMVAPAVVCGLFLALSFPHPESWRVTGLVGVATALTVGGAMELRHFRKHGISERRLFGNQIAMMLVFPAMALLSGGVESPFLPTAIPGSLAMNIALPQRNGRIATLWMMTSLGVMLAIGVTMPERSLVLPVLRGEGGPSRPMMIAWTGAIMLFTAVAGIVGHSIRGGFERALRQSLEARSEVLSAYNEQLQSLTTLTGEIAHELKNPLASIKGLAALVAKDVSGRAAERTGVLRREVDRMQAVLEEFLNFSRPLSPLACEPVDIAEIARDVAALHEGMATARGVDIRVHADPAPPIRCDPRKVKQIVVNLVQNALEWSARAGHVTLCVEAAERGVRIAISDEGPGLPEEIAARVFEPGVSRKEAGSGLGLTIARALARQHGGDLTLANRNAPARGCVASLTLPDAPPAASSAEAAA